MENVPFSPSFVGLSVNEWEELRPTVQAAFIALHRRIIQLETLVRQLQEQLNQTSRNSSKPPSSDPPGTPRTPSRKPSGKSSGGQPGHPGAYRPLVPLDKVDAIVDHLPEHCSECGEKLVLENTDEHELQRHQVYELPEIKAKITEHRLHRGCCPRCGVVTTAELPPEIPPDAFGPRLEAEIALLIGRYRMSRNEVRDYAEHVWGVPISEGSIYAIERRMSEALQSSYQEVLAAVNGALVRYMDETPWKQSGQNGWLWVATTATATAFTVAATRGREVLRETFGEGVEMGTVVSDRYAAYDLFPMDRRGICHAHLRRDLLKLEERGGVTGVFAFAARSAQGAMFGAWKRFRTGEIDREELLEILEPIKARMHRALVNGSEFGDAKSSGSFADMLRHWPAMWRFASIEGVEPTNNLAERALRKAVLWRKSSFGTRSDTGSRFAERMLTVAQTCRQNGRDLIAFLSEALRAALLGLPAPSIFAVPDG